MIIHANPITPYHYQTQADAVAICMDSKKDGLLRGAEADMKIYLSYSTNRKPIACLLRDIMTDARANVALHFNQIDAAAAIHTVAVCIYVCFELRAASAAALLSTHLCLLAE